jgi:hypothetical protein
MKDEGKFLKKYHKAVVLANRNNVEKLKPRIASQWVSEWAREVGPDLADGEEFRTRFEDLLANDLGFSEDSKVSLEGNELTIDVGGCMICPGNDVLRQEGEPTLCPITPTGLMAISRVLGKKATLVGVDKAGKPVGYCRIKYELAEKSR